MNNTTGSVVSSLSVVCQAMGRDPPSNKYSGVSSLSVVAGLLAGTLLQTESGVSSLSVVAGLSAETLPQTDGDVSSLSVVVRLWAEILPQTSTTLSSRWMSLASCASV